MTSTDFKNRILTLHVYRRYFDAIVAGTKVEEYRKRDDYNSKRLAGKTFQTVRIVMGYPGNSDLGPANCIEFPWNGYTEKLIQNNLFGAEPIPVFAIRLSEKKLPVVPVVPIGWSEV